MPFLLSFCTVSFRAGYFADDGISCLRISVFRHPNVVRLLAGIDFNGSYLGSVCKEKYLSEIVEKSGLVQKQKDIPTPSGEDKEKTWNK